MMKKRIWNKPAEIDVPEDLKASIGGHPIVSKTLVRRGIVDPDNALAFIHPNFYTPAPASDLPGLEGAVSRIEGSIRLKKKILVWGDFDVDGITATALLISALKELGAEVDYHIPVRADESHGVNLPVLKKRLDQSEDYPVDLVLTCDTGITAFEAIDYAQSRGIDVIVTDHHNLPDTLPQAYAIVNPNMLPERHPLNTLPGVGVAYKLVEILFNHVGRFEDCGQYLDLVALGIVADVAKLVADTRYLLQRGLEVLRNSERVGLQILFEITDLNPSLITEETIGFIIGPRLNAVGRLANARLAVELLTTEDRGRARILALQLERLNSKRKLLTSQVFNGALAKINRQPSLLEFDVLVLDHPEWPAGVIGIVASRLVERYQKPTIMISTIPGELARGSARSVEGVDITAAISAQKYLLEGFGGHAMAAGLSIDPEFIQEFRISISKSVQDMGGIPDLELNIDGYLPLSDLSLELVSDLERLAPFGAGNPALTLVSEKMKLSKYSSLGREEEHLVMNLQDDKGESYRVIWWHAGLYDHLEGLQEDRFDLAYKVGVSTFKGVREVQVEWIDFQFIEDIGSIQRQVAPIEILDCRLDADLKMCLSKIIVDPDYQIWVEADGLNQLKKLNIKNINMDTARDRFDLNISDQLIIWTSPPGRSELESVINKVRPTKIVLCAVDPETDEPDVFLKRLSGILKYVINNRRGRVDLGTLESVMSHKETTIRKSLEWLSVKGLIRIQYFNEGEIGVELGMEGRNDEASWLYDQLVVLLDETAAFRRYYFKTEKETLIKGV
jgi:single-stranded-DNA-specific exonuclease